MLRGLTAAADGERWGWREQRDGRKVTEEKNEEISYYGASRKVGHVIFGGDGFDFLFGLFIKLDTHEKAKQKQRADKIITEKITEGKCKVHMEVLE